MEDYLKSYEEYLREQAIKQSVTEMNKDNPRSKWIGEVPTKDDLGEPIVDVFIDGKTKDGRWAIMTPKSYSTYGIGKVGLGYGQVYKKMDEEPIVWVKVNADKVEDYSETMTDAKGGVGKTNGDINREWLSNQTQDYTDRILQSIADYYGTSIANIKDEVFDEEAEMLYEYIGNNNSLRRSVYDSMNRIYDKTYARGGKIVHVKNDYNHKGKFMLTWGDEIIEDNFNSWKEAKSWAINKGYLVGKDEFKKGGGVEYLYKIQEKYKYPLQPQWQDELFYTNGRRFLTFKQAQEFKKKLQGLNSKFEYKVVRDYDKYANGGGVDVEDEVELDDVKVKKSSVPDVTYSAEIQYVDSKGNDIETPIPNLQISVSSDISSESVKDIFKNMILDSSGFKKGNDVVIKSMWIGEMDTPEELRTYLNVDRVEEEEFVPRVERSGKWDESYSVLCDELASWEMGGDIPSESYSWGGGIAVGSLIGGYIGYKIGRMRPQKHGFETEKKIGRKIGQVASDLRRKKPKKAYADGGGVDEFETALTIKPHHASRSEFQELLDYLDDNNIWYTFSQAPNHELDYIQVSAKGLTMDEVSDFTNYLDRNSWDYEFILNSKDTYAGGGEIKVGDNLQIHSGKWKYHSAKIIDINKKGELFTAEILDINDNVIATGHFVATDFRGYENYNSTYAKGGEVSNLTRKVFEWVEVYKRNNKEYYDNLNEDAEDEDDKVDLNNMYDLPEVFLLEISENLEEDGYSEEEIDEAINKYFEEYYDENGVFINYNYAKGGYTKSGQYVNGKVIIDKHPQGHYIIIDEYSYQIGGNFKTEQDAYNYALNEGMRIKGYSFAEGGNIHAEIMGKFKAGTLYDNEGNLVTDKYKAMNIAYLKDLKANPNKYVYGVGGTIGDRIIYIKGRDGQREGTITREVDDNNWEVWHGMGYSMVNKNEVIGLAPEKKTRMFGIFAEGGNINSRVVAKNITKIQIADADSNVGFEESLPYGTISWHEVLRNVDNAIANDYDIEVNPFNSTDNVAVITDKTADFSNEDMDSEDANKLIRVLLA